MAVKPEFNWFRLGLLHFTAAALALLAITVARSKVYDRTFVPARRFDSAVRNNPNVQMLRVICATRWPVGALLFVLGVPIMIAALRRGSAWFALAELSFGFSFAVVYFCSGSVP